MLFVKQVFIVVGIVLCTLPLSVLSAGFYWTEVQPVGDTNQIWKPALSRDGHYQLAAIEEGRVYQSSSGGVSWTETQPAGNTTHDWRAVSMSGDGSVRLAAAYIDRIYLSTTTGATWVETQPAGNVAKSWIDVDMSSDGTVQIAASYGSRLYLSTTTGATWAEVRPVGDSNKNWRSVSVSSDGSTILSAVEDGRLYLSTTTGATWAEVRPAGDFDHDWYVTEAGTNGERLLAGEFVGSLYRSDDGGVSWTTIEPNTNPSPVWQGLGMSSDGEVIMLADVTTGVDDLHVSLDGGVTWATQYVTPTGSQRSWTRVIVSENGENALAASGDGITGADRLFLGVFDETSPTSPGTPNTSAESGSHTPTWVWTTSTDSGAGLSSTTPYIFEWSEDENFIVGVSTSTITTTTFSHSIPLSVGTWYVRVRAVDAVGNTTLSTQASFVVRSGITRSSGSSGGGKMKKLKVTENASDVIQKDERNDAVVFLQNLLKQHHVYDCPTTEYFGQCTFTAIERYQKLNALEVTGLLNKETLEHLFATSSQNASWVYPEDECGKERVSSADDSPARTNAWFHPRNALCRVAGDGEADVFTPLLSDSDTTRDGRDLYLGMVGDDVEQLQKILNKLGFTIASAGAGSPGQETKYFGVLTEQALKRFQETHGIYPSQGYFGIKTKTYLKKNGY